MTAGIEFHFVDRQSSGTDQTAVHTTNRDAGATFGECLADLRPYEDDTGGGNPDRDEGLYENMRRGDHCNERRSGRTCGAEHGEERHVMQLDPDEHTTQHDPHEDHNSTSNGIIGSSSAKRTSQNNN